MTTTLSMYSGSQFIGKQIIVDKEFIPELKKINQFALINGIHVYVTSSIRRQGVSVGGNIVPPASRSNHLIGHAIDMNLKLGSKLYNSSKLKESKLHRQPKPIRKFIEAIRNDSMLRWGGDFNIQDPVHIDDNLNNKSPAIWDEKIQLIQNELINLGRPQAEPGEPRLLFLERPPMVGADVRLVQECLIELSGQFSMNPDGVFGPVTDRAVTTFQEKNNLEPDGIVGPGTRNALNI